MSLPAELKKSNPSYTVMLLFDDMPADEHSLIVLGNAELLGTAIRNIVYNACKYSNDHKAIIRLQAQPQEITVYVQDNGIGIPEAELPHIFQPFYRASHSTHQSGFGLGLSLAYRIIKLHKGNITVTSTEGKGSLFMITLPVGRF
jgi:signal transduction histidine kinase